MSITDAETAELSNRGYIQLLQKTVVLTDSQIKGLSNNVAVDIVAAPGAGKAIMPVVAFLRSTIYGNYTNIGDRASVSLAWLSAACNDPIDSREEFSSLFASAQSFTWVQCGPQAALPNSDQGGFGAFQFSQTSIAPGPDSRINTPMKMLMFNGNGVGFDDHGLLTGGDPANTLQVTIVYLIVDVS